MTWILQDDYCIFIRAAMSGRWTIKEEKHNHIEFIFEDGSKVFFNDARHFGSVKFGNFQEYNEILSTLGPDPLKEELTFEKIQHLIEYHKSIGENLLNQSIFNGCGNYLRAEALYASRINPFRLAEDLSQNEWKTLCNQLQDLMRLSYSQGGATIRSYLNLSGEKGKFAERFLCYGRKTDPDNRSITRAVDSSQRAIWYCQELQK